MDYLSGRTQTFRQTRNVLKMARLNTIVEKPLPLVDSTLYVIPSIIQSSSCWLAAVWIMIVRIAGSNDNANADFTTNSAIAVTIRKLMKLLNRSRQHV